MLDKIVHFACFLVQYDFDQSFILFPFFLSLSFLQAQGLPATLTCIQGLSQVKPKHQGVLKKLAGRYFATVLDEPSVKVLELGTTKKQFENNNYFLKKFGYLSIYISI